MKIKKNVMRVLISILAIVIAIGTKTSFAMQDYTENDAKTLALSYFRYANGVPVNGYALNTVGNEGESHHPIYQIISGTNATNYYCLNAVQGDSWLSGTVGATATYNRMYDLSSDIEVLKSDTNEVYKNIANSAYLKQILWILDNIYIPDNSANADTNLSQKRTLLEKAGLKYGAVDNYDLNDNQVGEGYRYTKQAGYDYTEKVSVQGKKGYFYYDVSDTYIQLELPDEMVEVAQQAALWYFTNYLENNSGNSQTYNVKEQGLRLASSNGTANANSTTWYSMESNDSASPFNHTPTNVTGHEATVEAWQEEMARILCWYLIDAADNYANTNTGDIVGSPLEITPATAGLNEKTVDGTNYYVVGPLKINEKRKNVYSLNNTISVNGSTSTGAYFSDKDGNKDTNQTVSTHVGNEFYIAVPKTKITGSNIQISFDGTYKSNDKKLWVSSTKTEQPVVEVTPANKPIKLVVNAPINKEFDLALRKVITKVTGSNGNEKFVQNEDNKVANRNVNVNTNTIKTNGTATYNHRKDPVVVEKGDIITYTITIYNEGDIDGYASTIVDKLPKGLALKGYTANGTTRGTYSKDGCEYSYEYNPTSNEITLTNVSKNTLKAYEGNDKISQESINIECEVIASPSTTNNYLTNIAYISGEYNAETNTAVETDRDSNTKNSPSANQNTSGEKYTGYHGGNNNNGDNNKNVYNDGTNNDDYFPGREDDDDFEVVVIKPAVFDLALQKYINSVISEDGTKTTPGRKEPTIDTTKLASKEETTAKYTQDKTAIKVKRGDYVLYTFTVYNEGDVDGYVNKITDNIPTGLQFVYAKDQDGKTVIACDSQGNMEEITVTSGIYQSIINNNSYWTIDSTNNTVKKDTYNGESTVSITCDVESYLGGTNKKLLAYDSSKDVNNNGAGLDRTSVTLLLRVNEQNGTGRTIRNEAAITEATDSNGNIQDKTPDSNPLKDRDSQTDKWPGKDGDKKYQDDEDYDNIILGKVDLALTKFIVAVSDDMKFEDGEYLTKDGTSKNAGSSSNEYTRATKTDTTPLKNGGHDAIYTRVKTSLVIPENSYVLYNIRVYNEGDVDVYAGEVKDYLPNYLDFVDCDFNDNYGWHVSADGKTVITSYLSEKNGQDKKLLAFDKVNDDGAGSKLDHKDLQVLCRVNANAPDKTKLVNSAEISRYEDEDGNEIDRDIDSEPDDLDENKKNKEGNPEGGYDDDDEDYDVVEVKKRKVDLALTKFIVGISEDSNFEDTEYLTKDGTSKNAGTSVNEYTRATKVDTTPLKNGEHDAKYTLVKTPLTIPEESYVLYNIRVYNEGEVDVYAGEVKDYLPDYLKFVPHEINTKYGWKVSDDGKTVTTSYLSKDNGTDKKLTAFDKVNDDGKGSKLDYKDLQIVCKVDSSTPNQTKLINSSEISKYEDKDGKKIDKDVDSEPNNLDDDKKNKEGKPDGRYNQDDEDYDVVEIKRKRVDLALTKFIVAVSQDTKIEDGEYLTKTGKVGSKENPYDRATKVDSKELRDNPECHDATYIMVKDPLTVPSQSYVLYNIRVYNEGETDVYAGEVVDHLPEYLDYVDCDFNDGFAWKVDKDGKTIRTTYLSHENGEKNLLKAFNKKTDDGEGSGLDYRDLQVLCRVNDKAPSNTNIVNVAEITKYEDKEGKEIPEDTDSKPDNVDKKNEDDDDYEVINVKTFDLSLIKYVTEVIKIEDGKTTVTPTGNVGDENDQIGTATVHRKKINSTIIKFKYTIKVTNEGDIAGFAKEIKDHIPEGLKFYPEDNKDLGIEWKDEGNNIISTRHLENTLLEPGESAEVYVILRWVNGTNNEAFKMKRNNAEISEDYNKEGVPDKDSTPDNWEKEHEDDDDYADVIVTPKTGLASNIIMYITFGTIILAVFGVGITAIKKYVI